MVATTVYWTAVERESVLNESVIYGSMTPGMLQRPVVRTHAVRVINGIPERTSICLEAFRYPDRDLAGPSMALGGTPPVV